MPQLGLVLIFKSFFIVLQVLDTCVTGEMAQCKDFHASPSYRVLDCFFVADRDFRASF